MENNTKSAKEKLLLIGGGGHCRSVIDAVIASGKFTEIGIVDKNADAVMGFPVVGNDADLHSLFEQGWAHAFVSVGSVGNTSIRSKLYQLIREIGFEIPAIIDPSAVIARSAQIADGVFVGKRSIVNANVSVGTAAIVNSGAILEHDCKIGDFVHISPGAILCGNVKIADHTHVGAGAVVKQQVSVGKNVMIGAGSVVLRDISDGKVAYGNPCRVIESL